MILVGAALLSFAWDRQTSRAPATPSWLPVPVVVACGDGDLVTPPDHSRALARELPQADLVIVPDTGHQALMERPDLVNPPLLKLVAGVFG